MKAAQRPTRPRDAVRLLVLDSELHAFHDSFVVELPQFLRSGDLLVVNDAATIPSSLRGKSPSGYEMEIRLVGQIADDIWQVVLFGQGDWTIPTELRDPPEFLPAGSVIEIGTTLAAEILEVSSMSRRLVTVRFNRSGASLWTAIYAYGKPTQYSYLTEKLALWSTQTLYASRPWAVEMPSAGNPLSWRTIVALRARRIEVAPVTHAAGLSATGDEDLDAILPLTERFEIPETTAELIRSTRQAGGRLVAVGTSVVRALEGCAIQNNGRLKSGHGSTDLIVNFKFKPQVVDGLLTGMHDPSQSHFRLLRAFVDEATLRRAWRHAAQTGYRTHEFGDVCLIVGKAFTDFPIDLSSDPTAPRF